MPLQIRLLRTAADAHHCAELLSSSEPWVTLGRQYDESLRLIQDPSREVYVAFEGNEFRGFISLILHGAFVGYLQLIAVVPGARGSGVGTELMKFAEARIFEQYPNVFLCVSSFNPRAKTLYERLGYETIGEIRDFLVRGHSEFLMRKTIAPIRDFTPKS